MRRFTYVVLALVLTEGLLCALPAYGAVGTSEYGDVRSGVIAVYQDGAVKATAAGDPATTVQPVFSSTTVSDGSYGKSGFVVAVTAPYTPNQAPTGKLEYYDVKNSSETEEELPNGTVVTYVDVRSTLNVFYEWEAFVDVWIRSLSDVKKVQGQQVKVVPWTGTYEYMTPTGDWCGGFGTKKYEGAGEITYTPWSIYSGAGPTEVVVDVLFEVTPRTYGAGVETGDGFVFSGTWAGVMGVSVDSFDANTVTNIGSSVPTGFPTTDPTKTTGVITGDPKETKSSAADWYTSTYNGLGTADRATQKQLGGGVTSVTETNDVSLVNEIQGYYMTRQTLTPQMYRTDSTTQETKRVFSADMALTDAPASVRVPITQRIAPKMDLYRNKLSYNYYTYRIVERNGINTWGCYCDCGDDIQTYATGPEVREVTYDRSATVTNVYTKYTLKFKYVQITDWSKSTKIPIKLVNPETGEVNLTGWDDPYISSHPPLNETDLFDFQGNDTSGGVSTKVDNPPPPIIIDRTETDPDPLFDTDDVMTYVWIGVAVLAVAVVLFVVIKARGARRVAGPYYRTG